MLAEKMKLRHLIILKVALLICLWLPAFFIWPKISLADTPTVAINEIAWMGATVDGIDSKDWWRYEWLELYNNTDQPISLEGWKIELYRTTLDWGLELKGSIPAQSYFLIVASDKIFPNYDLNYSNLGGKLNNNGQKIFLKDHLNNIIDEVDCFSSGKWFAGDNNTKQTMERKNPFSDGNLSANWQNSSLAGGTPRTTNSPGSTPSPLPSPSPSQSVSPAPTGTPSISPSPSASPSPASESNAYQYSQNIFINEFLPYPTKDELEWVELFNEGSQTINLTGWGLSDSATSHQPFQIANDTKIEPGAYLVVSLSKSFLNNDGDQVKLLWPDGQVVHSVSYQKAKQNFSCAKLNGQWLWTNQPTPGEENKNSYFAAPTPLLAEATPNAAPIQAKAEIVTNFVAPKTSQATELTPSPPNILGAAAKEITTANSQNEPPLAATSQPAPNSKIKTALELLGVVIVAILASLAIIGLRRKTKNKGN